MPFGKDSPLADQIRYRFMASIRSLLNPLPESSHSRGGGPLPISSSSSSQTNRARDRDDRPAYHHPRAKRQKMPKDVPIFIRGKVRGELRYPPCEYQDAKLAEEHRRFQIHPMGQIAEFPRHIPYNSEKKSFLEKTGRESFEGRLQTNIKNFFLFSITLMNDWNAIRQSSNTPSGFPEKRRHGPSCGTTTLVLFGRLISSNAMTIPR